MGLDAHGIRFLVHAKALGVDFSHTAMIGRQEIHATPAEFRAAMHRTAPDLDATRICDVLDKGPYAEEFFRLLGAEDVHSFDRSNFEGATHVHDMNDPIPSELKRRYSTLVDGGSLEHVFHFPTAIKNCMEMVRVGGHFIGLTITNNFSGHGFYQFSPELFFRIFSAPNGYEMKCVVACEEGAGSAWYRVKDPEVVRRRGLLVNCRPVYLLVLAQRVSDVTPFLVAPQQSDYATAWQSTDRRGTDQSNWQAWVERRVPTKLLSSIKSLVGYNKFRDTFFEPYN